MIVTHIIGGLGNQMFQYAFGRALALHHNVDLGLDVSDFPGYRLHNGFELARLFNVTARIFGKEQLREEYGWITHPWIWQVAQSFEYRWFTGKPFVIQNLRAPVKSHLKYVGPQSYLKGYWQSEDLFSGYADQIRSDFTFKSAMDPENKEWADRIASTNAISVHVRRGDYLSNPKNAATHGVCSLDYYYQAANRIAENTASPEFFIFSDDPEWVKSNLKLPHPTYISRHNKPQNSFNDMRLMSLCQHHITANSSFSWWGAWLNPRPDKIVIAPKKWFADTSLTQEVVPESWLRI